MDEEFILQVSEVDLAEFPEPYEEIPEVEFTEYTSAEGKSTFKENTGNNTSHKNRTEIPCLLDLKLPKLYAARRNGCKRRR